jgi:hypothetical protein
LPNSHDPAILGPLTLGASFFQDPGAALQAALIALRWTFVFCIIFGSHQGI